MLLSRFNGTLLLIVLAPLCDVKTCPDVKRIVSALYLSASGPASWAKKKKNVITTIMFCSDFAVDAL